MKHSKTYNPAPSQPTMLSNNTLSAVSGPNTFSRKLAYNKTVSKLSQPRMKYSAQNTNSNRAEPRIRASRIEKRSDCDIECMICESEGIEEACMICAECHNGGGGPQATVNATGGPQATVNATGGPQATVNATGGTQIMRGEPSSYDELGPGYILLSDSNQIAIEWSEADAKKKEQEDRAIFMKYFAEDEDFVKRNYKNLQSNDITVSSADQYGSTTSRYTCSFDPEEELTSRLVMQHFDNTPIQKANKREGQARIDMINCSRDRAIRMQAAAVKRVAEKAPKVHPHTRFQPQSPLVDAIVKNKREQCKIRGLISGIAAGDLYSMFESFGIPWEKAASILKQSRSYNIVKIEPGLGYNIGYYQEAGTHLEIADLCDLKEDMEYISTKQAVIDLSSKPQSVANPTIDHWSRRYLYKTACADALPSTRELPIDKMCRAAGMQLIASGVGIPELTTLSKAPGGEALSETLAMRNEAERLAMELTNTRKDAERFKKDAEACHRNTAPIKIGRDTDANNNSDGWWKDPYKLLWKNNAHRNRTMKAIKNISKRPGSHRAYLPIGMLPGHIITPQELEKVDWGGNPPARTENSYNFTTAHNPAKPMDRVVAFAFKELKDSILKGKLKNSTRELIRENWLNILSKHIFNHFMGTNAPGLEECIKSTMKKSPKSAKAISNRVDECFIDHYLPIMNEMDTHLVIIRAIHQNATTGSDDSWRNGLRAYDPHSVRSFIYRLFSQYKQELIGEIDEDEDDDIMQERPDEGGGCKHPTVDINVERVQILHKDFMTQADSFFSDAQSMRDLPARHCGAASEQLMYRQEGAEQVHGMMEEMLQKIPSKCTTNRIRAEHATRKRALKAMQGKRMGLVCEGGGGEGLAGPINATGRGEGLAGPINATGRGEPLADRRSGSRSKFQMPSEMHTNEFKRLIKLIITSIIKDEALPPSIVNILRDEAGGEGNMIEGINRVNDKFSKAFPGQGEPFDIYTSKMSELFAMMTTISTSPEFAEQMEMLNIVVTYISLNMIGEEEWVVEQFKQLLDSRYKNSIPITFAVQLIKKLDGVIDMSTGVETGTNVSSPTTCPPPLTRADFPACPADSSCPPQMTRTDFPACPAEKTRGDFPACPQQKTRSDFPACPQQKTRSDFPACPETAGCAEPMTREDFPACPAEKTREDFPACPDGLSPGLVAVDAGRLTQLGEIAIKYESEQKESFGKVVSDETVKLTKALETQSLACIEASGRTAKKHDKTIKEKNKMIMYVGGGAGVVIVILILLLLLKK